MCLFYVAVSYTVCKLLSVVMCLSRCIMYRFYTAKKLYLAVFCALEA